MDLPQSVFATKADLAEAKAEILKVIVCLALAGQTVTIIGAVTALYMLR